MFIYTLSPCGSFHLLLLKTRLRSVRSLRRFYSRRLNVAHVAHAKLTRRTNIYSWNQTVRSCTEDGDMRTDARRLQPISMHGHVSKVTTRAGDGGCTGSRRGQTSAVYTSKTTVYKQQHVIGSSVYSIYIFMSWISGGGLKVWAEIWLKTQRCPAVAGWSNTTHAAGRACFTTPDTHTDTQWGRL